MRLFLFLHTGRNLYAHRYVDSYTDSYDVEMIKTEKYSVKHDEIQESAVLKKDVSETFLVAAENPESALTTKYIWKNGSF